jgi:hypothetical protein
LLAAAAFAACGTASATENGGIRALLGAPSYEMTTPAFPGWYGQTWYQHYDSTDLRTDSGDKTVTSHANIPGVGPVAADFGYHIKADVFVPRITYIAEQVLWDGHLGFSATLPIIHIDQQVTLTPQIPAGAPPVLAAGLAQAFAAKAAQNSGSRSGQGDLQMEAFADWQMDANRVIAGLEVIAPTGDYDKARGVINPGMGNYWTINPMIVLAHIWENGWQFGVRATYSFNTTNKDTQIRSGQYFHDDWSMLYHWNDNWQIGAQGYNVIQTTSDEGPWVDPNGNKVRINAVGPSVAYLSDSGNWALDVKVLDEFGVRNRPQGIVTWARLNFRF